MKLFNWAQNFKQTPTRDDILKKVRRTEVYYWVFLAISIIIAIGGATIIENAPQTDIKQHAWGLFLAIVGIVNIAVIKIWAHIRLTMYFTIWERKNWIDSEIRNSQAQDL